MSGFDTHTARAARVGFTRLGQPARVTPPFAAQREVWVIVDRNVELLGAQDELAGRRTLVSLLVADGAVPQGTEILIGASFDERLVVEQVIENDGEVLKAAVQ